MGTSATCPSTLKPGPTPGLAAPALPPAVNRFTTPASAATSHFTCARAAGAAIIVASGRLGRRENAAVALRGPVKVGPVERHPADGRVGSLFEDGDRRGRPAPDWYPRERPGTRPEGVGAVDRQRGCLSVLAQLGDGGQC